MSTQLPAEWQQKIDDEALEFTKRFKDNNDYQGGYIQGFQDGYSKGAVVYGTQLLEAQGTVKTLEAALNNIVYPIKYLQDQANLEGAQLDTVYAIQLSKDASFLKDIATKALSPHNKLKEDE